MIDTKRYLDFLDTNGITQQQFLLLLCLYLRDTESIIKYKKLFPSDDDTMIGKIMYSDLVERGFIEEIGNRDDAGYIRAASIVTTEKFNKIFVDKFEAADQFRKNYPDFILSDGKSFPTKYWDEDELREIYWQKIKGIYEEHIEVLKDLDYAKKHNLIRGKMETFVKSRAWEDIRRRRIEQPNEKGGIKRNKL